MTNYMRKHNAFFSWITLQLHLVLLLSSVFTVTLFAPQHQFISFIQSSFDISKLSGLFFTSSNYPKCILICTSGNSDLYKSLRRQSVVGEGNQKVLLIQIDASSCAEFEISLFEIAIVDCTCISVKRSKTI